MLSFKYKIAEQKCQQFCSMAKFVETKLNKIVTLAYFPYNPKAKLRLEVFFNKFYPRINMATLFLTKSYLLNPIKPFSGHKNRSLTKSQKPLQGGVRLGT
jgi:hypothetical protein